MVLIVFRIYPVHNQWLNSSFILLAILFPLQESRVVFAISPNHIPLALSQESLGRGYSSNFFYINSSKYYTLWNPVRF